MSQWVLAATLQHQLALKAIVGKPLPALRTAHNGTQDVSGGVFEEETIFLIAMIALVLLNLRKPLCYLHG